MKKQRTPQEKKALSLKKDRRNNYGESRVASVKSIRRRKRTANRTFRHGSKQVIQQSVNMESDTDDKTVKKLQKLGAKRKKWKKLPDVPLGQYINEQKEKAVTRTNRKKDKKVK